MASLNGGLIGPLRLPTVGVASGIWTADEHQQWVGAGYWPGTAEARGILGNGSPRTDPLSANLQGAWPLNTYRTSTDVSGLGRNLGVSGSVGYPSIPSSGSTVYTTGAGTFSNSNYFTLSSGTINCKAGNSAITIEAWIYVNTGGSQTEFTILNFFSGQSEGGFKVDLSTGRLNCSAYQGFAVQSNANTIAKGSWYHVAYTRTSTNNHALYINGVQAATLTDGNMGGGYSTNQIGFSQYGGGGQSWSEGYIQDLRIYNTVKYASGFNVNTVPSIVQ
jgi:hypothetical protein